MTMNQLRSGLSTRLKTITGLRSFEYIPDDPQPPIAIVLPQSITYDVTMTRGMDEYEFVVLVLGSRVSDRAGQLAMDAYCNPSGSSSIKAAIEGDKTLGGVAFDCRVREMRNLSQTTVGEQQYLSAEFVVTVYAQ